jgi:hypothetical protein
MNTVPEPPAAPPDDVQIALAVPTDNGPKPDDPDQALISQDPNVTYDDEGDD